MRVKVMRRKGEYREAVPRSTATHGVDMTRSEFQEAINAIDFKIRSNAESRLHTSNSLHAVRTVLHWAINGRD